MNEPGRQPPSLNEPWPGSANATSMSNAYSRTTGAAAAHTSSNRALVAHGVRHSHTRPYRPQTTGKAERFIQTAKREWAYARAYRTSAARTLMLPGFLYRYNSRRPHRGIGNITPFSRRGPPVDNLLGTDT